MADSSFAGSAENLVAGRLRIGLIGYGAIGGAFHQCLEAVRPPVARVVAVLTRTPRANLAPGLSVASLDDLLKADPDLVVECAGQAALVEHVPILLREGKDVVVASIGALADEGFATSIRAAANQGGSRLIVASGLLPRSTAWRRPDRSASTP